MSNVDHIAVKHDCARLLELLLDIAVCLVSSGSHTGKTIRIIQRFAKAYSFDVFIMLQSKCVSITVHSQKDLTVQYTAIRVIPHLAINFYLQSKLSALSWYVADNGLTLDQLDAKFHEIITTRRYPMYLILLTTSLANMSFCRLFGGDFFSMLFVFLGTACAFYVRELLKKMKLNHLFLVVATAFISSFVSAFPELFGFGKTAHIALATSVLFIVPGVPLLNSIIEILDDHVLDGIETFMNCCVTIVCLALGLLFTMLILGIENS